MFQKLKFFYLASILLCTLTACRQENSGIQYIPKDALGVFSVNLKSISKQVAWTALADSRVLKELTNYDKGTFDFNATGLDLFSTIFAYGLPDQRLESKFKFILILPLKDKAVFETYVKETFPSGKWEKEHQKSIFKIDDFTYLAWDKHTAICAFTSPAQSGTSPADISEILKLEILNSFSLTKDQSLASQPFYTDLLKQQDDVNFWFNYESFAKAIPQDEITPAGAILSSQRNLITNTFLSGSLNFKKGKIILDAKYYYNSSSKALAEQFTNVSYSEELLRKIPGKQMNLMMHLQLNPSGFAALVDTIGMMPLTRMALKENGLNPEAFFNLFQGDFLFTVVDFNFENLSRNLSSTMDGRKGPSFFQAAFTFTVRDQQSFQEVLAFALKNKLINQDADGIYQIQNNFFSYKENYVVASSDKATIQYLLSEQDKNHSWPLPGILKNQPFGLFADVKNTTQEFISSLPDDKEGIRLLKLIDQVQAYGGKVKGEFSPFRIEITLQDKEENSLLQLIRLRNKGE